MNDAAEPAVAPDFLRRHADLTPASAPRGPRIALLDLVRGGALVAMAIYHGAWDLSFFRLVAIDVNEGGWRIFARLIAGTFLLLSGAALALATRNGLRWRPYLRRTGMIALAAVLVTAATYFVMGEGFVFFGILHEIALASLLAIPFLAAPLSLVGLAAAVVFALPFFWRHAVFSAPPLWWVGLAPTPPPSFDYVPVFPWFGLVLAGLLFGRLMIAGGLDRRLAAVGLPRPFRPLAFAGRHSLIVYLVHQPILIGLAFVTATVILPNHGVTEFRSQCEAACGANGQPDSVCRPYCACIVDGLREAGELGPAVAGMLTPTGQDRLQTVIGVCRTEVLGPPVEREVPPP
ncbi:heparan-alpha-glucosaminide N-acetyltransferase domain-containing protein [Prosthecomicrobium pneumaticum]|uniref:Putative membrane protein n=1 Tax=Prosthecomicrobium pneumaticum TaxID=81895 RepID=A0A7W9FP39_9HYPH|nr:putative membrane protein [Prosthecomicrobium pneumaticum]